MNTSWEDDYEVPEELDFSKLKQVPNPFFQRFQDLHLVCLDDDVAKVFKDADVVNGVLRRVLQAESQELIRSPYPKAS